MPYSFGQCAGRCLLPPGCRAAIMQVRGAGREMGVIRYPTAHSARSASSLGRSYGRERRLRSKRSSTCFGRRSAAKRGRTMPLLAMRLLQSAFRCGTPASGCGDANRATKIKINVAHCSLLSPCAAQPLPKCPLVLALHQDEATKNNIRN